MLRVVFQKISFNANGNVNNLIKLTKMSYYAVAKGRTTGIFMSWGDCESQVKGFSGARYKKFNSVVEAQNFIQSIGGNKTVSQNKKPYTQNYSVSGNSKNNLKRSFSKSSFVGKKNDDNYSRQFQSNKNTSESSEPQNYEDSFQADSDSSDDLNTMLVKQLDDVEKRIKGFEKGVDKIIKNSSRNTMLIEPPVPKRKRSANNQGFDQDSDGFVQVYTDGACSANGRTGARAGIGVYFGEGHRLNTSAPVSGRATNNCGEIQAATKAIQLALQNGVTKLAINTDSQFLINSVTKWMPGWKNKGWKLRSGEPVKNEQDFKDLDKYQNKLQIKWNYVEAHRGVHGNEMADQLAKAGAAMYNN
ncbi:ribonuclease H1-like [Achroia grisella]|uniref:ribonuclease H1-like n=1 Tax=Achroia grisella TaxID=688607 RepID=UPI0027D2F11C|nr:ribonuclease H1-like [Achroia grisella]